MQVSESEKANPQDYFLPRDTGALDDQGQPIIAFDLLNEAIADYLPAKALRKKVFDGVAEIVILADTIQIFWKSNLIAEAQLEGQAETSPGIWEGQLFSFADANVKKITEVEGEDIEGNPIMVPVTPFYRAYEVKDILALGITDAVFGLDVKWAFRETKLSFYLDTPGFNARIRWQARVKDSAAAWTDNTDPDNPIYHKGLFFNASDYGGEVNHGTQADPETGWTQHWWTFEPSGKMIDATDSRTPLERFEQGAGLVVDPYLSVDEQATYFDVLCDGYGLRFYRDSDTNHLTLYDASFTTAFGVFSHYVYIASTQYGIRFDLDKKTTLIANSPTYVCIKVKGDFETSAQASLTNESDSEVYYHVYADRIVVDVLFNATGSITIDSSLNNGPIESAINLAQVTGETMYYEDGGSETEYTVDGTINSADYGLNYSTEINVQVVPIYESHAGTASFDRYLKQSTYDSVFMRWVAGTITAPSRMIGMMVIDAAAREGSAKIYTETDRLAMGDQYKDVILDQSPSKGDDVTDMIFPARISSGTLHADGAHHYEPDGNDELKFTLDRVRIRPNTVIHDWPFQYGDPASPTSILLDHLKMDDNTTNNTLVAEVGPNGTWHAVSDDSARNTSNDSVAANNFRGRALDTQNGIGYGKLAVGASTVHDNAFLKKGSVIKKITPESFGYDDAANQVIFDLYQGANDSIILRYNATNDDFELVIEWGGVTLTLDTGAYTENYSLQREMILLAGWDSDKDIGLLSLDGQIVEVGVNTGTPTTSEPSVLSIGALNDRSTPADIIIDEIKTFGECVLPYGAFFIGNGSGLLADIDIPHADLSWYFDGQAAIAKGGTDLATSKNPTNSGGQFITTDPIVGAYHWDSNGSGNVLTIADSSEDIVDYNKGFVAGWFQVQSAVGGEYLIDVRDGDGSDRISAVLDASNNIDVTYRSNSVDETITGNIAITDGVWFFLKITWDDTGKVYSYINGQENGTAQDIANTWGGGSGLTWYFTEDYNNANGVDCFIGNLFMGKDPDTPEIWTAFGKPLHIPLTVLG
jgi:hypothetical protein